MVDRLPSGLWSQRKNWQDETLKGKMFHPRPSGDTNQIRWMETYYPSLHVPSLMLSPLLITLLTLLGCSDISSAQNQSARESHEIYFSPDEVLNKSDSDWVENDPMVKEIIARAGHQESDKYTLLKDCRPYALDSSVIESIRNVIANKYYYRNLDILKHENINLEAAVERNLAAWEKLAGLKYPDVRNFARFIVGGKYLWAISQKTDGLDVMGNGFNRYFIKSVTVDGLDPTKFNDEVKYYENAIHHKSLYLQWDDFDEYGTGDYGHSYGRIQTSIIIYAIQSGEREKALALVKAMLSQNPLFFVQWIGDYYSADFQIAIHDLSKIGFEAAAARLVKLQRNYKSVGGKGYASQLLAGVLAIIDEKQRTPANNPPDMNIDLKVKYFVGQLVDTNNWNGKQDNVGYSSLIGLGTKVAPFLIDYLSDIRPTRSQDEGMGDYSRLPLAGKRIHTVGEIVLSILKQITKPPIGINGRDEFIEWWSVTKGLTTAESTIMWLSKPVNKIDEYNKRWFGMIALVESQGYQAAVPILKEWLHTPNNYDLNIEAARIMLHNKDRTGIPEIEREFWAGQYLKSDVKNIGMAVGIVCPLRDAKIMSCLSRARKVLPPSESALSHLILGIRDLYSTEAGDYLVALMDDMTVIKTKSPGLFPHGWTIADMAAESFHTMANPPVKFNNLMTEGARLEAIEEMQAWWKENRATWQKNREEYYKRKR